MNETVRNYFLSPAPQALPQAAGFSAGLSDAPQAAGLSDAPQAAGLSDAPQAAGLSDAPQAAGLSDAPQAAAGAASPFLFHPNKFDSAITSTSVVYSVSGLLSVRIILHCLCDLKSTHYFVGIRTFL